MQHKTSNDLKTAQFVVATVDAERLHFGADFEDVYLQIEFTLKILISKNKKKVFIADATVLVKIKKKKLMQN